MLINNLEEVTFCLLIEMYISLRNLFAIGEENIDNKNGDYDDGCPLLEQD